MKIMVLSSMVISSAFCGIAQDVSLCNARAHGALAKECLRVVDQDGLPVADAKIWGGLQTGGNLNDFTPISGMTDTNGEYVIQGKCTNRIRCDIIKDGYYRSEFLLPNYGYNHTVKKGKWQPFGSVTVIVLRQIKGLGKLVVPEGTGSNVGRWNVPVWDRWIGFDLEKFNWTYMVFRTRTKVDGEGRLVSAHYGVISGAWIFGSETMRIGDACFNSTVNDIMIEDGYYLRKSVRENKHME